MRKNTSNRSAELFRNITAIFQKEIRSHLYFSNLLILAVVSTAPFVAGLLVFKTSYDQFLRLPQMEQQTAIAQGAARSWYFFILLTQAFFIPAASAFLSSKKIAGEVQSGAFQILRSSRASSISIVVSKYTSSVAVLMPFSIGLTGLYLAIVSWISSSVDYKLALLVISQIVFFTFYYNLLDIFISSISSSVLAATLASILLSYNFIIMGALLPETLQGQKLTTEYYWGRIMAYLEGREIIAWTEVQNAIILVSVVLGLLIVGSLLVVRKRQA